MNLNLYMHTEKKLSSCKLDFLILNVLNFHKFRNRVAAPDSNKGPRPPQVQGRITAGWELTSINSLRTFGLWPNGLYLVHTEVSVPSVTILCNGTTLFKLSDSCAIVLECWCAGDWHESTRSSLMKRLLMFYTCWLKHSQRTHFVRRNTMSQSVTGLQVFSSETRQLELDVVTETTS